jgi:hypothetical protein
MNTMSKLRACTARELLNRNFPPRGVVLDPWLRTEETAVIWSASGVGKTWLSLGIALAVAGGGNVGDWTASAPRRVLYIDGEMHLGDVQERVRTLLDCGGVVVPDREVALGNLTIVARQGQEVGQEFFDLMNPEHQKALMGRVRGQAEVLVLDNLSTLSDGLEDENDAGQFKKLQGFLLDMKRAGIVAILVHHANKGGRQMRGSTALETTFEVILGLTKAPLSRPGQASFKTEFGKFRAEGDHRLAARTWTLGEGGWIITDAEPEVGQEDPVVLALRSLDFTTMQEVGDKLGITKSAVSRRLKKARELGDLKDNEAEELFRKARNLRANLGTFEDFDGEGAEELAW